MRMRNAVAIESRQEKILQMIRESGKISVRQLYDTFGMSVVTIRNDLILLEEQGLIIRTHGGAIAVQDKDTKDEGTITPFDLREENNFDIKQRIGKAAAELVNDGEVIFIDGGTTASEMRHYLKDKRDITIITPSIVVTYWLAVTTNLNVYVLNGFFRRSSYSTTGIPAMDFLADWNLSKAFFGAAGFTDTEGLSDLHIGFVEQKKIIAQKARMNIGLIDSSKWGLVSLGSFVRPEDIDLIISDTDVPAEDVERTRSLGIEVRLV